MSDRPSTAVLLPPRDLPGDLASSLAGISLHRACLARARNELLAPLATIAEVTASIAEAAEARPPQFRSDLQKMREACESLAAFLRLALAPGSVHGEVAGDDIFRGLRHEIRNRLNPVLSYCQFLQLSEERQGTSDLWGELQTIRICGELFLQKLQGLRTGPAAGSDGQQADSSPSDLPEDLSADVQFGCSPAEPGMVLVVDDQEPNRNELARLLREAGHTVVTAENGRQALERLEETEFDVVLLDVNMGEMNGYQVLREMKRDTQWRGISVVMVTGIDSIESIAHCIALGADDYLFKPLNFKLLQARIDSCLAHRRLRRQEKGLLASIKAEKQRADDLLYQLFPHPVVQELLSTQAVAPRRYSNVAVLFCDVVGFTPYCDAHDPAEVIARLQELFEGYERLADHHGVEKIKTIGDCFMATGGLLAKLDNPVLSCIRCAREMITAACQQSPWNVRIGIHSGPVVVGLIGKRQYCFDVWGDTVNTAARLQSVGDPGTITLSAAAWAQVADQCRAESRRVEIKGKGMTEVFRFRRFQGEPVQGRS